MRRFAAAAVFGSLVCIGAIPAPERARAGEPNGESARPESILPASPTTPQPAPSNAPDKLYTPAYGDIQFVRKKGKETSPLASKGELPTAVFSHWFHRMRFRCYVCHPSVFKMEKGANDVGHDTFREKRYCGLCHDGSIAWPITQDNCNVCHKIRDAKLMVSKNQSDDEEDEDDD